MRKSILIGVLIGTCVGLIAGHMITNNRHEATHLKNEEVIRKLNSTVSRSNSIRGSYRASMLQFRDRLVELEEHNNELSLQVDSLRQLTEKYSIGSFKVTAYSPYDNVSGMECEGDPSVTATGTTTGPGTVAVDPEVIPYGSVIIILYDDGSIERGIAEDCGGLIKGNIVDVFRQTYAEAKQHGRKDATIIWYEEVNQ